MCMRYVVHLMRFDDDVGTRSIYFLPATTHLADLAGLHQELIGSSVKCTIVPPRSDHQLRKAMDSLKPTVDSQTEESHRTHRHTPSPKRECGTCMIEKLLSDFPDVLCTAACNHYTNTCKECTQQHILVQLIAVRHDRISCLECTGILDGEVIRPHDGEDAYNSFRDLERRATEPTQTEDTTDGQVLNDWQIAENAASRKEVGNDSRPCLACRVPIEKVGGCKLVECKSHVGNLVVKKDLADLGVGQCKRISCWYCGEQYSTTFPGNVLCACPAI